MQRDLRRALAVVVLPLLWTACPRPDAGDSSSTSSGGTASSAGNSSVAGGSSSVMGGSSSAMGGSSGGSSAGGSSRASSGSGASSVGGSSVMGNSSSTGNASSFVASSSGGATGLTIPMAHPRLFWNADRLARARAYFGTTPFTPVANVGDPDRALDAALHGLLANNATSCRAAITWAMSVQFTCPGVSCDPARWDGEGAIVTYDWCYDHMTQQERDTFVTRWNTYTTDLNAKPWGGIGMEGNNYYLGYLRNTLEFALASYHDNPQAPALLAYGMQTRWEASLRPYLDTLAKGGAPHEGAAYGRRVFAYLTIPFTSLTLMGRNVWEETPYFRESIYWIIYSTSPGPSTMPNAAVVYETFPFNEDERWLERDVQARNTAQTTLGTYLFPFLELWGTQPAGGHAKRFLTLTSHTADDRFARYAYPPAITDAVTDLDLSALPLDYHAPGLGMLYAKTSWNGNALWYNAQLSTPEAVGHEHRDVGSFQLWRSGQWISRESVGYAQDIAGYMGTGMVDCGNAVGHNTLLFDGLGPVGYRLGRPVTTRLSSTAELNFVAVDLTNAYEVNADWAHREDEVGTPGAGRVVREFYFVRPLETLVILDRMEGSGTNPASVVKTFLLHFANAPTLVDAQTVRGELGGQALTARTLVPTAPTRRVVDEGGAVGQQRVEIEQSGTVVQHFLHALHAHDVGDPNVVTATLQEDASSYTVTLSHPTRGSAVLTLQKGLQSTGGAFGYAASGTPTTSALRNDVQQNVVDAAGVRWNP